MRKGIGINLGAFYSRGKPEQLLFYKDNELYAFRALVRSTKEFYEGQQGNCS